MAISNVFLKKIVCLSVCLTFFESADARDLGLMTLLSFVFQNYPDPNLHHIVGGPEQ